MTSPAASWNPWSTGARTLDTQTLDWLKANPKGGAYGGYFYAPNGGGEQFNADTGGSTTSPSQGWARTFGDEPQGRNDWEAYAPDGNWRNSYIGGAQSGLDKYGWMIPVGLAGGALALAGTGAGAGTAAAAGGLDTAAAAGVLGGAGEIAGAGTLGVGTGTAAGGVATGALAGSGGPMTVAELGINSIPVVGAGPGTAATAGGIFGTGLSAADLAKAGVTAAGLAGVTGGNTPDTSGLTGGIKGQEVTADANKTATSDYDKQLVDSRTNFSGVQGTQTWVTDPITGRQTLQQTLSPGAQALIDSNTQLKLDANDASRNTTNEIANQILNNGFSMDGATPLQGLNGLGVYSPTLKSTVGGMKAPEAPTTRYGLEAGAKTATPEAMIRDLQLAQEAGLTPEQTRSILTRMLALDPEQFSQRASDAVYGTSTRYLEPQLAQEMREMEARLGEQGFVPGTPAYQTQLDNFRQAKERSYADARDRSITQGYDVGNQSFDNSLDALKAAMAGQTDLYGLDLKRDMARSTEGLDLAKFGKDVEDTNFNQRNTIAKFLSGQDDQLFRQGMDSNLRGLDIARASFEQTKSVDDAGRNAILDQNKNIRDTSDVARLNRDSEFDEEKFRSTNSVDQLQRLLNTTTNVANPTLPTFPSGTSTTPDINRPNPFTGAQMDITNALNQYNADVASGVNQQDAWLKVAQLLAGFVK